MATVNEVVLRIELCEREALNTDKIDSFALASATRPDWSREEPHRFYSPSRRLLQSIRRYQYWSQQRGIIAPIAWLLMKRWVVSHRFWSIVSGADIPINSRLGGGLLLPHPSGVVIHPQAQIGPNCLLQGHVVIGIGGKKPGVPTLMGQVDVGAGACILGGVYIGEHSKIGANAVVLDDVPPRSTAVGLPAKVLTRKDQPTSP